MIINDETLIVTLNLNANHLREHHNYTTVTDPASLPMTIFGLCTHVHVEKGADTS